MGYRDPNEALRAENESLQRQLKEAQDEIDALRGAGAQEQPPQREAAAAPEPDGQRWAMGMRCLGGVALMLPFLLMTAVCEHRMMPRHRMAMHPAFAQPVATAAAVDVPRPNVPHACQGRSAPSPGFEHFTRSIERSARVTQAENAPGVAPGTPCTVRVVPVSMQDFNCHVEVVCNGQTVYGALPTGYAHCDVDRAALLRAFDAEPTAADGDPAVNVDLTSYRAVVTDTQDGKARRVQMVLDAPPSFE